MARNSKPKQQDAFAGSNEPGVGVPVFEDIDAAIKEYTELRDERLELTPNEVAAKKKLLLLMKAHEAALPKNPGGKGFSYQSGNNVVKVEFGEEDIKVKALYTGEDLEQPGPEEVTLNA